jgi:acyl dehydratase
MIQTNGRQPDRIWATAGELDLDPGRGGWVVGGDISQHAVNLGWQEITLPAPVFEGDTLYAQSEVLSQRESKSRPHMGLVEIKTTGYKPDGTVVMTFRRTILVYKRGHVPHRPTPTMQELKE